MQRNVVAPSVFDLYGLGLTNTLQRMLANLIPLFVAFQSPSSLISQNGVGYEPRVTAVVLLAA